MEIIRACYICLSRKRDCLAPRGCRLGGQNSHWLRLFGNRRSKTLRNRAMSWKGFRAWLQVALGEVWPSDVGCILKYLEERHEVQPLRKTTPGALLSSLSLLESRECGTGAKL